MAAATSSSLSCGIRAWSATAQGEPEREVGKPRIYYVLTTAGKRASASKLSNPLRLLYPQFTAAYFRGKKKLYSQPRRK